MIVMKFGGMSIEGSLSIERMIAIVLDNIGQQPVLVYSAMGKTTRNLLNVAALSAAGDDQQAGLKFNEVKRFHFDLAEELLPGFAHSETYLKLDQYVAELQTLFRGLHILRELSPRSQDKILAYGELMATTILVSLLRHKGIDGRWLDARKLIVTDDEFTHAAPLEEQSYSRIQQSILPILASGAVPVLQGFIGATRDGDTTTLGFEGSDFTAALVGAALGVSDIQIWKEVPGIMTADPAIIAGAHTIRIISFDEAAELAFLGAKVLHPSSIAPARQKDIPVHIFNSKCPAGGWTEICSGPFAGNSFVKSITHKKSLLTLRISAHHEVSPCELLKSIHEIFERERIVPYATTASGAHVVAAISASVDSDHLSQVLSRFGTISCLNNRAAISLVGNNLDSIGDIAAKVLHNLRGMPIDFVSHGASPHSLTVVVNEGDVAPALERLHEYFFKTGATDSQIKIPGAMS